MTYAIEGNGQRESHRGEGYTETDKMYTLNTIERHAVCFQCCGDRKDPSVSVSDKAYCLPANPMSDRQQAICFQQNQRDEVRDMGEKAGSLVSEPGSHNQNYVCYAPEQNHCGAYGEAEVSATLATKYHYGTGGDAALVVETQKVFENHPSDSRCTGPVKTHPTVTAKYGTGGGNTTLIVGEVNDE